ncbi:hypothetical protein SAMN05444372_104186 [Flavobacterium micromati]|jgi:ferredoxin-thioredoxin reductase catalytic subunit|uniref:Uncharacterized protein n=1 Tax=Flavobacterium micromati TaxID=229205 RepID=A0A1M5IPG0_9FLAO|nr:hypothetical protein SAMN05444372_104186 [Flavobacterium micromati]
MLLSDLALLKVLLKNVITKKTYYGTTHVPLRHGL